MSPKTCTMLVAALFMTVQNWKQLSISRRMGQKKNPVVYSQIDYYSAIKSNDLIHTTIWKSTKNIMLR